MTISEITTKKNQLSEIKALVKDDLEATYQLISAQLFSDVSLIKTIGQHIVGGGGKRLRPLTTLLAARALNVSGDEHIELATVIEFIHTATLLHDDVVDQSERRRGQPTPNALWGNQASVLVGDFLYSRAFQLLATRNNIPVMKVLANTTNAIAEGEVLQLMNCNDPDISQASYYQVISNKTAELFSAATRIGAIAANADAGALQAMTDYGLHFGIAYQIIDDLLDYSASSEQLGKNIGDDLAEGKITLPLIFALERTQAEEAALIRDAIKNNRIDQLPQLIEIMHKTDAFTLTQQAALSHQQKAQQALNHLPDSPYKQALFDLAEFVVTRHS